MYTSQMEPVNETSVSLCQQFENAILDAAKDGIDRGKALQLCELFKALQIRASDSRTLESLHAVLDRYWAALMIR